MKKSKNVKRSARKHKFHGGLKIYFPSAWWEKNSAYAAINRAIQGANCQGKMTFWRELRGTNWGKFPEIKDGCWQWLRGDRLGKLIRQFRGKNCLDFFYFCPSLKGTTLGEISDSLSRFSWRHGCLILGKILKIYQYCGLWSGLWNRIMYQIIRFWRAGCKQGDIGGRL